MTSKNITPLIVYPVNTGYVNELKPIIYGNGEPKAAVNGLLDGIPFSAAVLDSGVWSYKAAYELSDLADHKLSITQTNANGETSPAVSAQFRTDTKLLAALTVTFPQNNQNINSKTPVISGTGKAGATAEASIQNAVYKTVVNQDGF